MKRFLAVCAILAVVIVAILWAGWHNYQRRLHQHAAAEAALGTHVDLIPDNPAAVDGMVDMRGHPAPDLTLTTTDGQQIPIASLKGKAVLINFWATWCAPCKVEMPWFAEFQQKYRAQGLTVLGIAKDSPSLDDLARVAAREGVNYPFVLSTGPTEKSFGGIEYLPETFYIGRNGLIVEETSGLGSKDEIEADIQKALATQ